MRWTPGQHCFLRFTSFGLQAFSSHPFTICSLPAIKDEEKSELVFYIRHSHGLTQKLYDYAQKHPGSAVSVLVDGPYGGINMQRFNEADRLLVVAGGSGAGWIFSFLELFCRQRSAAPYNDTATEAHGESDQAERATMSPHQSLRIVLATRDIASRTWFLSTVNELLARCSTALEAPAISIEVHLTGEAERATSVPRLGVESKEVPDPEISTKPSSSSSSSSGNIDFAPKSEIQVAPSKDLPGRPDLPSLVKNEGETAAESGSALSVYVCGPGDMLNDVRNAVAQENVGILRGGRGSSVYLHSEHFSWA
jgi:ferredoxin-NADP reductase